MAHLHIQKSHQRHLAPIGCNSQLNGSYIWTGKSEMQRLDTQQSLRDPIHDTLRKHNRFQAVVLPC